MESEPSLNSTSARWSTLQRQSSKKRGFRRQLDAGTNEAQSSQSYAQQDQSGRSCLRHTACQREAETALANATISATDVCVEGEPVGTGLKNSGIRAEKGLP